MRQGAPARPPSSPIPATVVLGQGKPSGGAELAELGGVSFTCALIVFGERMLPDKSAPGEHFLSFECNRSAHISPKLLSFQGGRTFVLPPSHLPQPSCLSHAAWEGALAHAQD